MNKKDEKISRDIFDSILFEYKYSSAKSKINIP